MRSGWLWRLCRWKQQQSLEWAVQCQLMEAEEVGVNSDFQAGYVCALHHSWSAAGYPESEMVKTARSLVNAHVISMRDPDGSTA